MDGISHTRDSALVSAPLDPAAGRQGFNPLEFPICFERPLRRKLPSWLPHTPFAMCLVAALRPRTIVELGTHYGDSYCSFCQAVDTLQLDTRCFAVDTWR